MLAILLASLVLAGMLIAFRLSDRRVKFDSSVGSVAGRTRCPMDLDLELWQEAQKREQRELAEELAALEAEAAELSFELTRRQKLITRYEQLQAQIEKDRSISEEERAIREQLLKTKLAELLGEEERGNSQREVTIHLRKEGSLWQADTARPANTDGKSASGDA